MKVWMFTRFALVMSLLLVLPGVPAAQGLEFSPSTRISMTSSNEGYYQPLWTPYGDEFDSPLLDSRWMWIREDASHWSLTEVPGYMRIVTQYGCLYLGYNDMKNVLLQSMPDWDFDVITKVSIDVVQEFTQAGLLIYQDDDNFLKLVRSYNNPYGGACVTFNLETDGSFRYDYRAPVPASVHTLYLKISRRGTTFTGYHGEDGVTWISMGQYSGVAFANPKFGLMACNGYHLGVPEMAADFDFFHVTPPPSPPRILRDRAASLARNEKVLGAPYGDRKGYDYIHPYYYFDEPEQIGEKGLDCSGLGFWSYNRAYYAGAQLPLCSNGEEGNLAVWCWENRPVKWFGANGQYNNNVDRNISKEQLKLGDLLFFDEYPVGDNVMNHVGMYMGGPFELKYGEDETFTYNAIEATAWGDGIITVAFYDPVAETLTTLQPSTGKTRALTVDGYGRVKDAKIPEFKAVARSPVDLIVIDPDGEIIDKAIGQSPTMEYQVYDIDGDDELDDIVIGGKKKIGNYSIEVVPEPHALPEDTYSLEVTADGQTIVLAEAVPISDIPDQPYLIQSTETEINAVPVANANGPYIGDEGSPITFDGSGSYDPDGDSLQYRWDFDGDGTWDIPFLSEPTAQWAWDDDFCGTAVLEVTDGELYDTDTVSVTVNNVPPTAGPISAPVDPVQINTPISATAIFTDPGVLDTHTAVWDWGNGSTSAGTVNEAGGSGSVTGSYTYTIPGVYAVKLVVTDDDGDSGQSVFHYVVVYDPEGGFVTGGGWIDSPPGAYTPDDQNDEDLTGKATFGFVCKHKKGATEPTGQTEFQFKVADLNFHSDRYDWLVVARHKAMYKGVGTINGAGHYGFMLSAIDEKLTPSTDVDLFRIKIWDKDNGDAVLYDNQMGDADDVAPTTAIGGGCIVIHDGK